MQTGSSTQGIPTNGERAAKQRLQKSAPGARRRDTVCAEERSTFRKQLGGESVVGAKQGTMHIFNRYYGFPPQIF